MKRIIALFSVVILLLCAGCDRLVLLPEEDASLQPTYAQACDLLKEGKLEEAQKLFLQLGGYKDSAKHAAHFVLLPTEIRAEDDGFGETMAIYKTTYSYDEKGHLLKGEGAYTNDEGPGYSEEHTYDEEGNLLRTHALSEAGDSTLTYEYNAQGQLIKRVGYTAGANVGGITRYTYDAAGNCTVTETASFMGIDTATYETDEPYHTERVDYTYNEQGLCTKSVNDWETPMTNTAEYNAFGLPAKLISDDGQGYQSETVFSYDEEGRCIQVDTPYDTTTFTYEEKTLPVSAIRTRDGGKPCNITYTYQLFYTRGEQEPIPFHLSEYLSVFEV